MAAPTSAERRQAYEAEKAALDAANNVPTSAYERLGEAFFGSEQRRRDYDEENAALDAGKAPLAAYARLHEAFFGTQPAAGAQPAVHHAPIREWIGQHLDGRWGWVAATAGALFLALLIEGPGLVATAITSFSAIVVENHSRSYTNPVASPERMAPIMSMGSNNGPGQLGTQGNGDSTQSPSSDYSSTCAVDNGPGNPHLPFSTTDLEVPIVRGKDTPLPPCAPLEYHVKPQMYPSPQHAK